MSDTVSILFVIPVDQNDSLAAAETLRSIKAQTYPESMVRLHRVQYVSGSPEAHTSALNAARGIARETDKAGYVVHAEPGLMWEPRKLERQVLALQEASDPGASVHPMSVRPPAGRPWRYDLSQTRSYGPRISCFLRPPWGPGAVLTTAEADARVGAFRNVEQVLWEYAVRMAHRLSRLDLIEDDLAVWNPESDADGIARTGRLPARPLVQESSQPARFLFLKSHLDRLTTGDLFNGAAVASPAAAASVHAALHLLAGDVGGARDRLAESGGPERVYWEALLQRTEGAFDTASAAFRSVRSEGFDSRLHRDIIGFLQNAIQLPDYGEGRETASRLLRHLQAGSGWDAPYFTRLCREALGEGNSKVIELLKEIQQIEYETLFDWTFRQAVGAEDPLPEKSSSEDSSSEDPQNSGERSYPV